jgi:type I restriction enzyme S subunit
VSNVDKKTLDGEVPVRLVNYTDVYYGDRLTPGMDLLRASASESQVRACRLFSDDVVITKDSETPDDIGVAAYVDRTAEDMVCGYHLAILRPLADAVDGRFLYWSMVSSISRKQLSAGATGVTRYGLRLDVIGSVKLPAPPLPEQRLIADFLDAETARIDALIAKKRRLIELLGERLSCQIDRTVWSSDGQLTPLTHLVPPNRRIMYGIVLPGPDVEDGVPIVKGGDVKSHRLNLASVSRTTHEIEAGYVRSRLVEGDIVFAIRGGVGDVEVVPRELTGANITQDVARVAPGELVSVRWLLHSLRSRTTQEDVQSRITGATIRGINIWDLGRVVIPVPDMEVQVRLAARLDALTSISQRTMSMLGAQIDLLVEHRQALITAAVTGELDVAESIAEVAS